MKKFNYLAALVLAFSLGCNDDGYIDPLTPTDPGPDMAAPVVSIEYPFEGVRIRVREDVTPITVQFRATDDIEIAEVVILLDGTEITSFNDFIDYRQTINSYTYNELTNGTHTLTVQATDISGKTTTETVTFEKVEPYTAMEGEVLYLPFDGDLVELISLNAGAGNNVTYADGVSGRALSLDAARQAYVTYPSTAVTDLESFTLSLWVNPDFVDSDNSGSNDGILGLFGLSNVSQFWGNIDFFVENNSNPTAGADMRIHIRNGDSETWITNVNDVQNFFGQWSNHVITYDAATSMFTYYINGEVMTTAPASWSGNINFTNPGPLVFGTAQFMTNPSLTTATGAQSWASYLTGELDEVRMFERALSDEEVTALYESVMP